MRRVAAGVALAYLAGPYVLRYLLTRIYQPPDLDLLWPEPSSPSLSTSNEEPKPRRSDASSSARSTVEATAR